MRIPPAYALWVNDWVGTGQFYLRSSPGSLWFVQEVRGGASCVRVRGARARCVCVVRVRGARAWCACVRVCMFVCVCVCAAATATATAAA